MPLCDDLVGSFADGEEFLQRLALAFVFVLATIHRLAHWLDAGFDPRCPIIGARLAR